MHEATPFLLDARMAKIALEAWGAVVILYGLWRSLGDARPDAIRGSGPIL
jgi:hypothetical protein